MDLLIAFVVFVLAMAACLIWGGSYSMLAALAVGLAAFFTVGLHRGFSAKALLRMSGKGVSRCLLVVRIFVLIGLITALWRSGGTITYFVYYGIRIITPGMFLLAAFLLTSLLAMALGTSFGIVGTVGVILITLARSGGVSAAMVAGAVLSGAYFGDRTAPASSSANLVATVTGTQLYDNVKQMLKTSLIPFLLCTVIYGVLSVKNPLQQADTALLSALNGSFHLSPLAMLPAALMLLLPLLKVDVRLAMLASAGSALLLTILLQGASVTEALKICVLGFTPENPQLTAILTGGGLISMVKVSGIILLSSTYSGIFEGTGMLDGIQQKLSRLVEKIGAFGGMLLTSMGVVAVFCNQTIGIMMMRQLMGTVYEKQGLDASRLALDLEDSVVVIVGLFPWCIACALPLEMMGVGVEALPFALLLYLIPVWRWLVDIGRKRKQKIDQKSHALHGESVLAR